MKTFVLISALILWQPAIGAELVQGTVFGWGINIAGEATGVPVPVTTNSTPIGGSYRTGFVSIAGHRITNAVAIAAGTWHGLALLSDTTVVGWGANLNGEATGYRSPYPGTGNGRVEISGQVLSNVVAIAAGDHFSLALRSNGSVVAWGENAVPPNLTNIVAIAVGDVYSLALRADGELIEWGSQPWAMDQTPPKLTNILSFAIGDGDNMVRSLALKTDGTVVAWGRESVYRDQSPPSALTHVVGISAGFNHSLALLKDGRVFGWGFNNAGQATGSATRSPYVAQGLVAINGEIITGVVQVVAGTQYSLALKGDGTVVGWGDNNNYGQLPRELSHVSRIAIGNDVCLAIITNAPPFGR